MLSCLKFFVLLGAVFSLSLAEKPPVENKGKKVEHALTVSSRPQGLTFKVYDKSGAEVSQGKTPMSLTVKVAPGLLKVQLFFEGQVVAEQLIRDFNQDSIINFVSE